MLNISLIFTRVVNHARPQVFWTREENLVVQSCFDLYDFLPEKELCQYGAASLISKTTDKIIELMTKLLSGYPAPVSIEDLAETLHYCIVWLYNTLYENETRKEATKIGLFRVLDKAFT